MDRSIDLLDAGSDSADLGAVIDARVDECSEGAFAFLERLIAAPSTVGQEQGALEVFAAELESLDFSIERQPIPQYIADLPGAGVPLVSYDGRYDVVARRAGRVEAPSLLLNGHIDVVPADEPALWTTPPFTPSRRDGWLYGRGSGDMKCGFAMGVLALRALRAAGADTHLGPLTFVAAIEEECTGNGTLATIDAGVLADAVVVLEPTDLNLLVGGVGILWVEIAVEGRAAHAEAAAGAVNAIEAALPLLAALHELEEALNLVGDPRIETERPLRVNVGRFRGGDWTSSVPSVARLDVRVGYPYTWTPREAEAFVNQHIASAAAADPWLAAHPPRVTPVGFRALGYDLPTDHPLVDALAQAHRAVHATDPDRFAMATTTDARSYIHQGGVPAICYGPRTARIHGIDEAVELASIVEGARVLARFIAAWSARPSQP